MTEEWFGREDGYVLELGSKEFRARDRPTGADLKKQRIHT